MIEFGNSRKRKVYAGSESYELDEWISVLPLRQVPGMAL